MKQECDHCKDGDGWLCENHMNKPWSESGCECGAGAPCPWCNPLAGPATFYITQGGVETTYNKPDERRF